MTILVYIENGGSAELVAIFANEKLANDAYPLIEEMAAKQGPGAIVTETLLEYLDIGELDKPARNIGQWLESHAHGKKRGSLPDGFAAKGEQTQIEIEGRGNLYITENEDGVSLDLYATHDGEDGEPNLILSPYALNEDFDGEE